MICPHIGSATRAARERMIDMAVANVRAFLAGEPLVTPVGRISTAQGVAS